jgi:hypothetical protein
VHAEKKRSYLIYGKDYGLMVIHLLLGLLIILITCSSCISGQTREDMPDDLESRYNALEQSARKNVTVTYMNASSPIGHILLIRNDKDVCAVRFTDFRRGRDAKPPTVFSSGQENLYAEYDWYYQGDGTGDFTTSNVKSGHQRLKQGPMVGIGRLSLQRGTNMMGCGPFNLSWVYPNNVGFHSSSSKRDDIGNELAPTKWKDIHEINVRDPHLKWYRFDEKRDRIIIPVDPPILVQQKVSVYLIPLDDFSDGYASQLSQKLTSELRINAKATLAMGTRGLQPFPETNQYPAEDIVDMAANVINNLLDKEPNTAFMILTNRDINEKARNFRYFFSWHDKAKRISVISSARMGDASDNYNVSKRFYKMTKRAIGEQYFRLTRSADIKDIMYSPIMSIDDIDRMGDEFLELKKKNPATVFAGTKTVVSEKNEYDGKTTMVTFSANDEEYKNGMAKGIIYFDSNEKIVKMEAYFTDEFAKKDGASKGIGYYEGTGRLVKTELYHTDESARKDGAAKTVFYLDSNQESVKKEFYDQNGNLLDIKIKKAVEEMALNRESQKESIETIRTSGLAAVPYIVKYIDNDQELPIKYIMVNHGGWEIVHYGPRTVGAALGYLIFEIVTPSRDIRRKLDAVKFHPIRCDDPDEEEIQKWRTWCAEQWPDMADTCWNRAVSNNEAMKDNPNVGK